MKKLSKRTQELISTGLNAVGHSEPLGPFFYIEERLYVNEVKEIAKFFQWLYNNRRGFGSSVAQQRWTEFQNGEYVVTKFLDLRHSFEYTVCGYKQTAVFVHRLPENTLQAVCDVMRNCSQSNHYTMEVVDQDDKVISTYTHEQVFKPL